MLKEAIKTMFALMVAFILQAVTYAIGKFSFANAPLFSLNFFYDVFILVIYYLIILFIINKVIIKKH